MRLGRENSFRECGQADFSPLPISFQKVGWIKSGEKGSEETLKEHVIRFWGLSSGP